jgi:hypothetical protein
MDSYDPLLEYSLEENPPPNPVFFALKRAIWIIITLLVILSLITSLLLPIILSRRGPPPRDPENEIQASLISNPYPVLSVQYSVTSVHWLLNTEH